MSLVQVVKQEYEPIGFAVSKQERKDELQGFRDNHQMVDGEVRLMEGVGQL